MIVATALNLTRATFQDIFDYVVLALIQQGKPSSDGGSCLYRSGDVERCAAGHLISDSEYNNADGITYDGLSTPRHQMECTTINAVIERGLSSTLNGWAKQATGATIAQTIGYLLADEYPTRIEFLRELQQSHDGPVTNHYQGGTADEPITDEAWLAGFRVRARQVANKYRLDAFMVGYRSGF